MNGNGEAGGVLNLSFANSDRRVCEEAVKPEFPGVELPNAYGSAGVE